jgi:hypothetical protein
MIAQVSPRLMFCHCAGGCAATAGVANVARDSWLAADREREAIVMSTLAVRSIGSDQRRPTKKPGPGGPVQFADVGAPAITFQRGTAASISVASLGG